MKRFAAHYALLPSGLTPDPLVEVGDDGRILSVRQVLPSQLDGMAGVEFHSGVLIPSMVNAHSHLELACLRGAIAEGCGFAGFAASMAAVRNRFTDDERLKAMVEADREMYNAGIGAVGDISNDDSSFGIKARSHIHYHTFGEVFGLKVNNFQRVQSYLSHPLLCHSEHQQRISQEPGAPFSVTAHSLYSLNDDMLKRVCSEGRGVLSIHFMESPAEQELFEGRGSLREWFDTQGFEPDFLHYGSPAERLVACVPADRSVMLVHCTCVTQRDIDLIMNHFRAPVYWCLCPVSNSYISNLKPDLALWRQSGLNVCIGTDSLASNRSLTMSDELRMLGGEVSVEELLRWATVNGAEALGLEGWALEAGNRCGVALVRGVDFGSMRLTASCSVERLA